MKVEVIPPKPADSTYQLTLTRDEIEVIIVLLGECTGAGEERDMYQHLTRIGGLEYSNRRMLVIRPHENALKVIRK